MEHSLRLAQTNLKTDNMTILNTLKLFGMGILGGTLPLATYVIIQHNASRLSDQVI
ncbi:MAG: hypothetical protein RL078_1671, partial [Bacteroidota bacterium]